MSELENSSTAQEKNAATAAALLLANYSFDLGGYPAKELVEKWSKRCPTNWIRLAVIEALYQGRYKAISVDQILTIWLRRNQALYHFRYEFERLVCNKLPLELQEQFFSSNVDSLETYPQPPGNSVDISAAETSHLRGERTPKQETVSRSAPFETLAQPVLEEVISEPSIGIAEIKPNANNAIETSEREVASVVSEFDRISTRQVNGNTEFPNNQKVATLEFTNFASWFFSYSPIDRFIPDPPFADLHTKLKALADPSVSSEENKNLDLPAPESKPEINQH